MSTVRSGKLNLVTNLGTLCNLWSKTLLLDLKMFFNSLIKLNELYETVEKHFQKNFSIWLHNWGNVPYRSTPYRM